MRRFCGVRNFCDFAQMGEEWRFYNKLRVDETRPAPIY